MEVNNMKCIVIQIEEIIGNGFIHYLEKTGNRMLKMYKLEEYAIKVIEQLNTDEIKARLNVSREADDDFFYRYSNWFTRIKKENKMVVVLKEDVTTMQLYQEFATSLSLNVLSAFKNPTNIQVLLE